MDSKKILMQYIPMAEFISKTVGSYCEVVISDLSNAEQSILYITEPSLTGRKVGGPITDYALELVSNHDYHNEPYVCNYIGKGNNGKTFRSSTYFITNEGKLIGLFCVNIDISGLLKAKDLISEFLTIPQDEYIRENFNLSLEDMTNNIIQEHTKSNSVDQLSVQEKQDIVAEMQAKGLFLMKGAVMVAAEALNVSEQSIYRYIKNSKRKLRENENENGN
ncbi:MAG: YheO-like PAS domain protein [Ruminococcaceae bacterium]|nr:YheO-like PAS domain protein [Oscillospiraceae bacterium]HHV31269.1 YheO-like PAS domain protein [Clostridiales bacterium]